MITITIHERDLLIAGAARPSADGVRMEIRSPSTGEVVGTVPMATGERFTSIWDFQMLLRRRGAEYLRPDPGLLGGITGLHKVAVLAEANHAGLVPHNPMGPVITAASLHVAASSAAFSIQEYPEHQTGADYFASPPASEIVEGATPPVAGFLEVPRTPGLGLRLRPDAADRFPARRRPLRSRRFDDGGIAEL